MGRASAKYPYVSLYQRKGGGFELATMKVAGRRRYMRLGTATPAFARRKAAQVSEWLQQFKAKLITQDRLLQLLGESLPIAGLLDRYRAELASKGRDAKYLDTTIPRVRILLEHADVAQLKHLTAAAVNRGLAHLREHAHSKGETRVRNAPATLSDQTLQHYQAAVRQFANWCKAQGYFERSPLEDVEGLSVGEKVHTRRSPTKLEARLLVEHVWSQPRGMFNLDGRSRGMLYLYAMGTGYRAGELRHVHTDWLDAGAGVLKVPGKFTKNGKDAVQPLPSWLIAETLAWLDGRVGLLWPSMPTGMANTLKIDLRDARAAWIAAAGDDAAERKRRQESETLVYRTAVGVFDFHALRHHYVTTIGNSGAATLKETQTLARHSTPMLTFGTYSHAEADKLATVIENAIQDPRSEPDQNPKGGD